MLPTPSHWRFLDSAGQVLRDSHHISAYFMEFERHHNFAHKLIIDIAVFSSFMPIYGYLSHQTKQIINTFVSFVYSHLTGLISYLLPDP